MTAPWKTLFARWAVSPALFLIPFVDAQVADEYGSFYINDALVHYIRPENGRQGVSVVMIPGLNLSSYTYLTTPDGRPGWARKFADDGYDVYVINDPDFDFSRGFSVAPFTNVPTVGRPPADPNATQGWQQDIWRRWGFGSSQGNPYPDTRFPTAHFAAFAANYPYIRSNGGASYSGAIIALLDRIGPSLLMAHSAGGPQAVTAAKARPNLVPALLLIEPTGPPDAADFPALAGISLLGVYGDYIVSRNQGSRKLATEAAAALHIQNGGRGKVISLPEELAIFGNTHLMMQDGNSAFIADLILVWLAANVDTSACRARGGMVSPSGYSCLESASSSSFPFAGAAASYQQAHDIGGAPRMISSLAFRRDGSVPDAYPARTVVIDLYMGTTTIATMGSTFASNFAAAPTQVLTNTSINLPDHSAVPIAIPAPFDTVIPHTAFPYSGVGDFLWECRLLSNSNSASYPLDAASGAVASSSNGSTRQVGNGCRTPTGVMELRWLGSTTAASMNLRWGVTGGPATAQTTLLMGTTANILVPGLCANLFCDGAFGSLSGTTTTAGLLNTVNIAVPYDPAYLGFHFSAQAASLDVSQTGIPVAMSNGLVSILSDLGPAVQCKRVFASGSSTAVTGSVDPNYALVTLIR
jgi:pimeloyl-ACP methyl ester carboxylesterase